MRLYFRSYGNKSIKNAKEKKWNNKKLQTQTKINSPYYAILNKLNEELEKLHCKKVNVAFI